MKIIIILACIILLVALVNTRLAFPFTILESIIGGLALGTLGYWAWQGIKEF